MFRGLRIQDIENMEVQCGMQLRMDTSWTQNSFCEHTIMYTHRCADIQHKVHISSRKDLIHLRINNKMNQTIMLDLHEIVWL